LTPFTTELDGVLLLAAEPSRDDRGSFCRVFDRATLLAAGIAAEFPQWSIATNDRAGTVRGLHFSAAPYEEAKLVRVVAGAIFDVVLDVRRGSASFGRWCGFELRDDGAETLYIPTGFAHGYQTLTDSTNVLYGISLPYVAGAARGINPFDPALGLTWPLPPSAVSARDRALPGLADYQRASGSSDWNP
jgi:dTDP-4-dehydrorhamnose 3,5-epimerase